MPSPGEMITNFVLLYQKNKLEKIQEIEKLLKIKLFKIGEIVKENKIRVFNEETELFFKKNSYNHFS